MVDVKATITELMQLDPELSALLPGGVYAVAEINRTMAAPHPFDAVGRVRPCALVRNEVSTAVGPRARFDRHFVIVFFYDHAGLTEITAALNRTVALLHEHRIGGGAYQIRHVDNVYDQYDDAILANMHRSRYEVAIRRK